MQCPMTCRTPCIQAGCAQSVSASSSAGCVCQRDWTLEGFLFTFVDVSAELLLYWRAWYGLQQLVQWLVLEAVGKLALI